MKSVVPSKRITRATFFVIAVTSTATNSFVIQQDGISASSSSYTRQSVLNMGKNSDRAHIERHLEEMMGDDWREFRAQLIARERAEAEANAARGLKNESTMDKKLDQEDQKVLNKQGQLGELFAGAISSIFNTNTNDKKQGPKAKVVSDRTKEGSIFDGDTIGGVSSSSSSSSYHEFAADALHLTSSTMEDPFVSAEEIPCHINPVVHKIDKHRWAHEISHVETGSVLIANAKLGGVFHQTVVLIVQHNDQVGSIGIVINRPLEGDLLKIASEQESKVDLSLKLAFTTSPVTYGGPVLTDEYSILHGFGEVEGSTKLCPGVYVGGSEELMNEVRINRLDPKNTLFVKGHAAWTPKQLQREISKGVWYVAAVSSDFILRYAGAPITEADNPHDLWYDILTCMGGKHAEIAAANKGRGDMRLP